MQESWKVYLLWILPKKMKTSFSCTDIILDCLYYSHPHVSNDDSGRWTGQQGWVYWRILTDDLGDRGRHSCTIMNPNTHYWTREEGYMLKPPLFPRSPRLRTVQWKIPKSFRSTSSLPCYLWEKNYREEPAGASTWLLLQKAVQARPHRHWYACSAVHTLYFLSPGLTGFLFQPYLSLSFHLPNNITWKKSNSKTKWKIKN